LPDWEHGIMTELVWWAIPLEIVLVLGALTWTSTHELDPHKALTLQGETLKIQVVALDWKWLFIYPEQNIATVNFVEFPANRPVEFDITADAPMNSFWIPQLGGQIYAMTGMVTKLNLVADEAGVFAGGSANYSGEGFAHMKFQARAVPQQDFDTWVGNIRASSSTLDLATYDTLARPSDASMQEHFGSVASKLYDTILMKFMPAPPPSPIHDMGAMQM
jgi:cytochrome o ubiquinol oxidase subunit 2